MFVRMGLLRKKQEHSSEEFQAYWRDHHGPLAAQVPHLKCYWQNVVTERLQRGIDFTRGPWDFDGISQLWLESDQPAAGFRNGTLAATLIEDENKFIGQLHIVGADQRAVIPVPAALERATLMKRMSTLRRKAGTSEEEFRREWLVHGELVKKMPGVAGYRQNVIVERELVKGELCGYDDLPIDGIVELWFADAGSLSAAFASPQGQETMAHAKTFLEEITAFVVEERQVK
ncbi:EthD domain-containing protein [Achromobacter spanius]|uniref:EthD domain-containing protein n=1 Tax=Achromobacter spanius TaxID=217203 RepID=UPI0036E764C8